MFCIERVVGVHVLYCDNGKPGTKESLKDTALAHLEFQGV